MHELIILVQYYISRQQTVIFIAYKPVIVKAVFRLSCFRRSI